MQVLQNKFLTFAYNVHWEEFKTNRGIHNDLNILSTCVAILRTFCKHYVKLWDSKQDVFREFLLDFNLENKFLNDLEDIN